MKTFSALFAAFFLVVVCFGLDLTYMLTSISEIRKQLRISLHDIQWVINIYVLFFATLLLPFSVLAAKLEKRTLCIAGLSLFCVSALLAFFSHEFRFILIARALKWSILGSFNTS